MRVSPSSHAALGGGLRRARPAAVAAAPGERLPRRAGRFSCERGQATVEFVALLPFVGLLLLLLWQAALAGEAFWLSGTAARAAARAEAVGADPAAAARTVLPGRFERGLTVHAASDGTVTVGVPVPALVGGGTLTSITTHARFEAQQ